MASMQHVGERAVGADGTFVVGPHGIIEDVDAGGCRLFGYSRDELVGIHGSELIPPAARPATAVSLDRMRRGELAVRHGSVLRSDGTVIECEVSARQLPEGRIALSLRRLATTESRT